MARHSLCCKQDPKNLSPSRMETCSTLSVITPVPPPANVSNLPYGLKHPSSDYLTDTLSHHVRVHHPSDCPTFIFISSHPTLIISPSCSFAPYSHNPIIPHTSCLFSKLAHHQQSSLYHPKTCSLQSPFLNSPETPHQSSSWSPLPLFTAEDLGGRLNKHFHVQVQNFRIGIFNHEDYLCLGVPLKSGTINYVFLGTLQFLCLNITNFFPWLRYLVPKHILYIFLCIWTYFNNEV